MHAPCFTVSIYESPRKNGVLQIIAQEEIISNRNKGNLLVFRRTNNRKDLA
jgi:hypothetical protein